jgi:excisionase family DNA binding protein
VKFMGSSKFISTKEAAERLGCTTRTIYRYTQKGILQAECRGRQLYILEDDILQHQKGKRELLTSPLDRNVIAKLIVEIQDLKGKVATISKFLNIRNEPLNLTIPEYSLFYQAADQYSKEGWPPHIEEMWSENFSRMRIEDLTALEQATGDAHPWRPFLRLVTTMYLNPWNPELRDMFGAGMNNVERLGGMWCVLKEESPRTFDILVDRDATPFKKLLNKLTRKQNPKKDE